MSLICALVLAPALASTSAGACNTIYTHRVCIWYLSSLDLGMDWLTMCCKRSGDLDRVTLQLDRPMDISQGIAIVTHNMQWPKQYVKDWTDVCSFELWDTIMPPGACSTKPPHSPSPAGFQDLRSLALLTFLAPFLNLTLTSQASKITTYGAFHSRA